jgi:hypothetical protein
MMNRKTIFVVILLILAQLSLSSAIPNGQDAANPPVNAPRANTDQCSYCMKNCAACKRKRSDGLENGPLKGRQGVQFAHWVRWLIFS